jgi:hypothetical protein
MRRVRLLDLAAAGPLSAASPLRPAASKRPAIQPITKNPDMSISNLNMVLEAPAAPNLSACSRTGERWGGGVVGADKVVKS